MHDKEGSSGEAAFTLVELLTVLIIITILIGILLPTITHIKRAAYNSGVQAQIGALRQAIDQYYADFHAYPGPVSNAALGTSSGQDLIYIDPNYTGSVPSLFTGKQSWTPSLTGPENLVLGLIGGLHLTSTGAGSSGGRGGGGAALTATEVTFNPTLVGQGPVVLNSAMPKKFGAYIDTSDLSSQFNSAAKNGLYSDALVAAINDSPVPEILDRFPNKMPILYLRANVGATMYNTGAAAPASLTDDINPVVIDAGVSSTYGSSTQQTTRANPIIRYAQYDISQIIAYTRSYNGACIGEGKTPPKYAGWTTLPNNAAFPFHGLQTIGLTSPNPSAVLNQNDTSGTYQYPYPAYPYIKDPNSPAYSGGTPVVLPYARAKDTYILISAGIDRIYGTADDITSFGDVRP